MTIILGFILGLSIFVAYFYMICVYIPTSFKDNAQVGKGVWYFDNNGEVKETFIKHVTYNDKIYVDIDSITTDDGQILSFIEYLTGHWGFTGVF